MTVGQLIDILKLYEPEARVMLMTQRHNWPCECAVSGVTVRAEFQSTETASAEEERPNDVFLLEGAQLRYGAKAAWDTRWTCSG